MKKIAVSVLIASAMLAVTGCISSSVDMASSRLRVRSFVDGCDVVKIKGDKVWYEHKSFALPGQWMGFNEATYVNGEKWLPNWNGSNSDQFEIADKQAALPANREFTSDTLKVTSKNGLGNVFVSEYPSENNGYTLAITIDDRSADGASWYEFGLAWEDEN